jgi:hypothetical protein
VNKGYLSSLDNFKTNYVFRIKRLEENSTLENLRTITSPFILRRLKTDENIKKELPEKIVNDMEFELELYYEKGTGLFAVESEAVESGTIYSPYTAELCEDSE